ncbi:MAG TPA: hypothetical protein VMI10_26105 [Terriglobales bacterium]|nr:hypothetical protein [Terriglobales bacterium]
MSSYRGKFQYLATSGGATQQGACQFQFDQQTFTLSPESGTALVFDLGDIDALIAADYEIRLALFTGNTVLLEQLGKPFQDLSRELLEAYRKRTLQCLLLEDLQEVDRFAGGFTLEAAGASPVSGPAEIRLFKSNLAVMPTATQAFQWRLADIANFRFDQQNYEITVERDGDHLHLNRLARRTELLYNKLRDSLNALRAQSGEALHLILPFLDPSQLQCALGLIPEGHSVSFAKLGAVHPRIPDALAKNAVDETLKPYFDELVRRSAKDQVFAGYKLVRPDENSGGKAQPVVSPADGSSEDGGEDDAIVSTSGAPDADSTAPKVLYWFFFPLATKRASAPNVVAWEASSSSGRATYFFRLNAPNEQPTVAAGPAMLEQAVARITRTLGLLNFRRRPIYLSDDELTTKPEFHRYAIAARKIADLRTVRAAFLGRAIHSSFEAWRDQVDAILAKAAG